MIDCFPPEGSLVYSGYAKAHRYSSGYARGSSCDQLKICQGSSVCSRYARAHQCAQDMPGLIGMLDSLGLISMLRIHQGSSVCSGYARAHWYAQDMPGSLVCSDMPGLIGMLTIRQGSSVCSEYARAHQYVQEMPGLIGMLRIWPQMVKCDLTWSSSTQI